MPKFIVYAPDNVEPGVLDKRYEVRPSHVERLTTLVDAGVVEMAGMITDPAHPVVVGGRNKAIGSLLIVEAGNIEEVRKTIEEDVFAQTGVWNKEKLLIAPFLPHRKA